MNTTTHNTSTTPTTAGSSGKRFQHRPPSLRRNLARAAATVAIGTLALGVTLTNAPTPDVVVLQPESAPAPSTQAQVDRLLDKHDCWSGDAPADMVGVIPPRSVVTLPGEDPKVVDGGVGLAIVFDGAAGTVHGFCRGGSR